MTGVTRLRPSSVRSYAKSSANLFPMLCPARVTLMSSLGRSLAQGQMRPYTSWRSYARQLLAVMLHLEMVRDI